jgi:hypothetical protein
MQTVVSVGDNMQTVVSVGDNMLLGTSNGPALMGDNLALPQNVKYRVTT